MNKKILTGTDLYVSPMGLGCVNAGLKWDGEEVYKLFDAFCDLGGNLFDTARVYSDWVGPEIGRSERVLGDWFSERGRRHEVVLITKGGHPDMVHRPVNLHKNRVGREHMIYDLDQSLRTLRTDYIDLYFYHRDDPSIPVEELIETMESFVKMGKIRYYGCSNWSLHRMKEAEAYCRKMGYHGFVANQVLYNLGYANMNPLEDDTLVYLDPDMQTYHRETASNTVMPYMGICEGFFHKFLEQGEESVKNTAYYTEGNIRIARNLPKLTEKYGCTVTQAVLGFFAVQDFTCIPLYGPRNIENLRDAAHTFDLTFSKEDYDAMTK